MSADTSRTRQRWCRMLVLLGGAFVLPSAALALGTFFPAIPYLGTAGNALLPLLAPQIAIVAMLGGALALAARRLGARRTGTMFAVVGTFAAASAGTVIWRHVRVASTNGVRVNLLATVVPRGLGAAAADATVAFTRVDGQELELDIYRPNNAAGTLVPIVFYVHGGGWILGDRRMQAANLRWFAARGYLAVSAEYVLATPTRSTWNTASAQVACALAWIAANAATYAADPERVFAFGESAGGALVLTTSYAAAGGTAMSSCGGTVPAVRAVAAEYPALDPVTFYENSDPLLGGTARQMVGQYLGGSPSEYPARAHSVSSASYIIPKAPPTLIFVPDIDHLVPIAGALRFIDEATRAGVSVRTVRFPWADHAVNLLYHGVTNQAMVQIMFQHFCQHGGRAMPSRA
jgi:acetyl esterase/lipase